MRLASNMLQFALAIFVLDLTGSALIFSTVLSAIIFPRIIGTPIAGYLADYKDCLRILKLGALGLTALMLSFLFNTYPHYSTQYFSYLCVSYLP